MKTNWNDPISRRRYYREYRRKYRLKYPESVRSENFKQYWKNPQAAIQRTNTHRNSAGTLVNLMYQQFLYLSNYSSRRESWKRYYWKNKPYHTERRRIYEQNNKDKRRIWNKNRKNLRKSVSGESCVKKLKLLALDRFCHWCCTLLTPSNRTVDHVIPLKRGGHHIPDNLVASCRRCNCSKRSKLVEEWTWEEAA